LAALLAAYPVQAFETKAKQAFLIDDNTGAIMLSKDAEIKMHPASMTKMMTIYLLFKELKAGKVKLDDSFPVSEAAWKMQGSKTFVEIGGQMKVEDLIRGILIQSGNDACVVVAEKLGGNEEGFAELMNAEAKKLGMTNTHFVNSTGWPEETHLTSAHDLATLAHHLIHDFPEYYKYFAEKEYTYHGIRQFNRNLLLDKSLGVDGLKTGHTEQSGYGITVSGVQNGRRVIAVVNGLESIKDRAEEAGALVRYGFASYDNLPIIKAGRKVVEIPVWNGTQDSIAATVTADVMATLPKVGRDKTIFKLQYDTPIASPIEKGAVIGRLLIQTPGTIGAQQVDLVAAEAVGKAGFFRRVVFNLKHLLGM